MVYESKHPLVKHKLALLRSVETKPKKFRELVRELAMLLCYEATQDLGLTPIEVFTPMGTAQGQEVTDKIGLVPVLRAGLGMVDGGIYTGIIIMLITIVAAIMTKETFNKDLNFVEE